jgi:histone arginine demethylase JMJD6
MVVASRVLGCSSRIFLVLLWTMGVLGGGKKPRKKKEWNAALNRWQEDENQQFMADYESNQQERERIRQKNMPKFDPENPKAYMDAMAGDDNNAGMMGAMGGGGSPDGAQITVCRLKPGAMKSRADTELLVSRWRDILTTIGIAAFPYVMDRNQVMINVQEGFRVPDIKQFALDQAEVKFFEHGGKKMYPKGVAADPADEEQQPIDETDVVPPPPPPKRDPTKVGFSDKFGVRNVPKPDASEVKPKEVVPASVKFKDTGGWNPSWSVCTGCKRACGKIAESTCNIKKYTPAEMTREKFEAELQNRQPFIVVGGSANMAAAHRTNWSRAHLAKAYGEDIVELGTPISLHDGHAASGHSRTFNKYLYLIDHFDEADAEGLYLFDSKTGSGKPREAWQLEDFIPPTSFPFGHDVDELTFSVGWPSSGIPFHVTGESWNELLWGGATKWYIYPPDQVPCRGYNLHVAQKDWVRKAYYKNGTWNSGGKDGSSLRKPMECMQQPGDILYVPTGWYHANMNCGQTVSVASVVDVDTIDETASPKGAEAYMKMFSTALNEFKAGKETEAIQLLQRANKLTQHSNDVILYNLGRMLGHVYGSRGDSREAVATLQRCTELNPSNARCWLYICVAYLQANDMQNAGMIFDRAWSLLPPAVREKDDTDEMKLIQKVRAAFRNAMPEHEPDEL